MALLVSTSLKVTCNNNHFFASIYVVFLNFSDLQCFCVRHLLCANVFVLIQYSQSSKNAINPVLTSLQEFVTKVFLCIRTRLLDFEISGRD